MLKYIIVGFFLFCLTGCINENPMVSVVEQYARSTQNFIPQADVPAGNYWSTKGMQHYFAEKSGATLSFNHPAAQFQLIDYVSAQKLFGEADWASYFPKSSSEMYLLFDVGWDSQKNYRSSIRNGFSGNFIPAEDKFTGQDESIQTLAALNQLCKEQGWKGAGVWVPLFATSDSVGYNTWNQDVQKFYFDRLIWSKQAGIEYWKLEFGQTDNIRLREKITMLAKEMAPDLMVEHTLNLSPVNDYQGPWDTLVAHNTGTFSPWADGLVLEETNQLAEISTVLRMGEVTYPLSIATTLERIAQVFNKFAVNDRSGGLLNCGDEPYMAAVLGCNMAVTRHPLMEDGSDLKNKNKKIDEVFRAIHWMKFAPPFPVGNGSVNIDPWRLVDDWTFSRGETPYSWLEGKQIVQKAPGRISRGMALPKIKDYEMVSYVLASRNPTGATSIATLPRIDSEKGIYYPLMDVEILITDWDKPVGIFGRYQSLTLTFEKLPRFIEIWGQDLASSRAVDITGFVQRDELSITLPGELINEIGTLAASTGDDSEPGMLLIIKSL